MAGQHLCLQGGCGGHFLTALREAVNIDELQGAKGIQQTAAAILCKGHFMGKVSYHTQFSFH